MRLFILSGGRDLYYIIGICAGSYYSGVYVVFIQASPIEGVGPSMLGLLQGAVKGP